MDKGNKSQYYHDTKELVTHYRDIRWQAESTTANAVRKLNRLSGSFGLGAEYTNHFRQVAQKDGDGEEAMAVTVARALMECDQVILAAGTNKEAAEIARVLNTAKELNEMLNFVDNAANLIRRKHKNGELLYWILYYAFLSVEEYGSVQEIIEQLQRSIPSEGSMSKATYHRYQKRAIEVLGSILWGHDVEKYEGLHDCGKQISE